MAAEGPLHELGAISIVNSDSQGMGRIGETRPADVPAGPRDEGVAPVRGRRRASRAAGRPGPRRPGRPRRHGARPALPRQGDDRARDHARHRRPRRVARPGRLADIVLWKPGFFGVKPEWVFKGGFPAWGPMGEGNAIARARRADPLSGGLGRRLDRGAAGSRSTFVSSWRRSRRSLRSARLGTRRTLVPVSGVRGLTRSSLHANRAIAPVDIDVRTGAVSLGGRPLAVDPVTRGPAQPPLPAAVAA